MTKFKYAPGLPGYGTKGVDGSLGLSGVSTYFSEFDGLNDTTQIFTKIRFNKTLFNVDASLPGSRIYQTGDSFIDKNGKMFEVDFNESNYYKDTNVELNTSGYFVLQDDTPTYQFTRYSNRYLTNPMLVDDVYSNDAINYGAYPALIYDVAAKDFQKIQYNDLPINSYYPFTVWSVGINDSNSIALVREEYTNNWHLGNLDGVTQRAIDLTLDFANINVNGNIISKTNNTYDLGSALLQYKNLYVDGITFLDDVSLGGHVIPETTNVYDLGTIAKKFRNINTTDAYISDDLVVGDDVSVNGIIKYATKIYYYNISGAPFFETYTNMIPIILPFGAHVIETVAYGEPSMPTWTLYKHNVNEYLELAALVVTTAANGVPSNTVYDFNDPSIAYAMGTSGYNIYGVHIKYTMDTV